jgi:hypothetical protein
MLIYKIIIILIIIFLILFVILNKYTTLFQYFLYNNVDIVYTWVENNPEFEKEKQGWLEKEGIKNKNIGNNLYTDHQELKYSIMSLKKYFPYYRYIYIVVKDGQYPKYIENDDKIKIVNHSEIIPKKYLPTFNSCVIEAYLHHIPNLSEYYLYLNDDLMFLKKLSIEYFIEKNSKPYILYSKDKKAEKITENEIKNYKNYKFIDAWCYNNYLLDKIGKYEESRYTVSHVPKMYRRSYDYIIEKRLKKHIKENGMNIYDYTSSSKFRRNDNLFLNVLIKPYLYKYWFGCEFKKTNELYVYLKNDGNSNLDEILTDKKNIFLTTNDEIDYEKNYENIINKYKLVMDKKFI